MNKLNVILAPMAGVTDKPFRQMVRHFSHDLIFPEMIPVEGLKYQKRILAQLTELRNEENIGVQLMGCLPESFEFATKIVSELPIKIIDINMGCPVKKIIQTGGGSALLKDIRTAEKIVQAVKKSTTLPVSVKLRLGVDHDHIVIMEYAKMLADNGINQITIHGRTQKQMYGGTVDYEWIKRVKEIFPHSVIANGDIKAHDQAVSVLNQTLADGVMIGRGILGRPWALKEIADGEKVDFDIIPLVLEHLDALLFYYGKKGIFVARKHLAWYAQSQKVDTAFTRQMYAAEEPEVVKQLIQTYFDKENK